MFVYSNTHANMFLRFSYKGGRSVVVSKKEYEWFAKKSSGNVLLTQVMGMF